MKELERFQYYPQKMLKYKKALTWGERLFGVSIQLWDASQKQEKMYLLGIFWQKQGMALGATVYAQKTTLKLPFKLFQNSAFE